MKVKDMSNNELIEVYLKLDEFVKYLEKQILETKEEKEND